MKRKVIAFSAGLIIILVILAGGGLYLTANASEITLSGPLQYLAQMYQANHWTDKLQNIYKTQEFINQHAQHPANPSTQPQVVEPDPSAPQPHMGILPAGAGGPFPFHATDCKVNNQWNGSTAQVFAGADPQNPQQGIVVLNDVKGVNFYRTSALDGGLTITAVNDSIATLSATDGATYTFDMNAGSLVRH